MWLATGARVLKIYILWCNAAQKPGWPIFEIYWESEHLLGTIVGQYRRLISTCAVRAQAMCILARVGLITPAAREAARRRQVAMRLEEQMREERRAQWMASLQGPGWARRGRCHGL